MSKLFGLGHSVMKGTGYGSVTATDTFIHKIGLAAGYAAADIINKGVSSDTSAGVLARIQADVIDASAPGDVCGVMIGVNDWSTGVAIATFKANLAAIVDSLLAASIKVVLFTDNVNRGTAAQFTAYYAYIEAIKEVAFLKGCPLVDVYGRMLQQVAIADHATYYVDTIHLSVAGHTLVADHAAKPYYTGFFVSDPAEEPVPTPDPAEESPLLMAVVDYILATGHPSLTAGVNAELTAISTT